MRVPSHVAIIMDGNGRWAEKQGQDRSFGHLKGAQVARKVIDECARCGVGYLTLYTFSAENWFRPVKEISFLMELLRKHLIKERKTLMDNNIRFRCIGEIERLPEMVRAEVETTILETRDNTGMQLTFALSYGSRQEVLQAVKAISRKIQTGNLRPDDIDESTIAAHLQSSFLPDPDLIIRTSGESRLSNFMLWQAAYAEIYVTDTFWPDFSEADLHIAFAEYASRERRFGRTGKQTSSLLEAST